MDFLIINKSLAVKGEIEFTDEPFFSLRVGSMVSQIGDGRENGCVRTDRFAAPFEYVGSFKAKLTGVDSKFFAFKIPSTIYENSSPHYMLYGSTGLEVLRERIDYVRFMKPIFYNEKMQIIN